VVENSKKIIGAPADAARRREPSRGCTIRSLRVQSQPQTLTHSASGSSADGAG
jgi:hypothetical protein